MDAELQRNHDDVLALAIEEEPGPWWVRCSQPDSPGDGWSIYVWNCLPCLMGLAIDAAVMPEAGSTHHDGDGTVISEGSLAAHLAAAVAYREAEGMPVPRHLVPA